MFKATTLPLLTCIAFQQTQRAPLPICQHSSRVGCHTYPPMLHTTIKLQYNKALAEIALKIKMDALRMHWV